MAYEPDTAEKEFLTRKKLLTNSTFFKAINERPYDPTDFGQQQPDAARVKRNDQRGLCIPPYFVFQFRSDGHPAPPQVKK